MRTLGPLQKFARRDTLPGWFWMGIGFLDWLGRADIAQRLGELVGVRVPFVTPDWVPPFAILGGLTWITWRAGLFAPPVPPQMVQVTTQPTAGVGPDVRLGVRNDGSPGQYGANCRVFAARNTGTDRPRLGNYAMAWDDGGGVDYLVMGQWGNLMVAHWLQIGERYDQLAEMRLTTRGGGHFASGRWNMTSDEHDFPTWGLEISVLRLGDNLPWRSHVCYFQVEPAHYLGPLRLRELRSATLDDFATQNAQ